MIVIIGAFGRTGRVVTENLRGSSALRLVTRDPQRTRPADTELATVRLNDQLELGQALRGARAAFVMLPDDLTASRFHAERRAMVDAMSEALRREAVPRIVLLSSTAAAEGEQGASGFAAELAYFERRASEVGAALTIVRATYFQDNVAQLVPSVDASGKFPNFWPGMQPELETVAATDVGTLAAQLLLEQGRPGREVVEVLGPQYTPSQMARAVGDVLGRDIDLMDVPLDAQERFFAQSMPIEPARAMVETLRYLGSPRSARRDGRRVRGTTRLEQVLARQVRS